MSEIRGKASLCFDHGESYPFIHVEGAGTVACIENEDCASSFNEEAVERLIADANRAPALEAEISRLRSGLEAARVALDMLAIAKLDTVPLQVRARDYASKAEAAAVRALCPDKEATTPTATPVGRYEWCSCGKCGPCPNRGADACYHTDAQPFRFVNKACRDRYDATIRGAR